VYVGQAKNFASRRAGHLCCARRGVARPLYNAIRKYGVDNFTFEIIENCDDDCVNDREQHWVSHYDSYNPDRGYNLTNGGNQNFNRSEVTRAKIGSYWSGRKQTSEHVKRRVESFLSGKANHKVGDTRKKLNADLAEQIMKRLSEGETIEALAKEHRVSSTTIRNIKRGLIYNANPVQHII
jgi:group I intron endonuclease